MKAIPARRWETLGDSDRLVFGCNTAVRLYGHLGPGRNALPPTARLGLTYPPRATGAGTPWGIRPTPGAVFFFQILFLGSLLGFLLGDSCGFSWVTPSVSYLPTAYLFGILDPRVPVLTGSTTRLYHTYLVLYNVPWPKAYDSSRRGLTNQEKSIPLPITLPTYHTAYHLLCPRAVAIIVLCSSCDRKNAEFLQHRLRSCREQAENKRLKVRGSHRVQRGP